MPKKARGRNGDEHAELLRGIWNELKLLGKNLGGRIDQTNVRLERLESHLKKSNVRIFKDVHQSGHASGQDVMYLLELLRPKHVIPSHGERKSKEAVKHIASALGYGEKQVHLAHDGQHIVLA